MNGDIEQMEDENKTEYLVRMAQRGVGERESIKTNVKRVRDKLDYHREKIQETKEKADTNSTWITVLVCSAAVVASGAVGILLKGILSYPAQTNTTEATSVKETLNVIREIRGMGYEELSEKIRAGKYDGFLSQIESWELDNQNRTTVLRAIAERKRKIRK